MFFKSTKYIFDGASRMPMIVGADEWDMVTVVLSKVTVYPASQNWPTERRERYVMLGKIVALRAVMGRCVFSRRAEHEEVIVEPFGVLAVTGGVV